MAKGFSINITGIPKVTNYLNGKNTQLISTINKAIHDAGFYVRAKVKDSIAGRASEKRSVDTGNFMGMVGVDNSQKAISIISDNTQYGKFMEYGTSRITARRHFRNTSARENSKVKKFISDKIK